MKHSKREGPKDIYHKARQELNLTEVHDNAKVARQQINLKKHGGEGLINLDKQKRRNMDSFLNGTEAYKNALRDRERGNFIKNLLRFDSQDEVAEEGSEF